MRTLASFPADDVAETAAALCALGGNWPGGRAALDVSVDETLKYKALLREEQDALATARRRRDGATARVDELFVMLRQQHANVDALAARSSAQRVQTPLPPCNK